MNTTEEQAIVSLICGPQIQFNNALLEFDFCPFYSILDFYNG